MFTSVSVAIEIYFLTEIHLGGNINGVAILIPSGDGRSNVGRGDLPSIYRLEEYLHFTIMIQLYCVEEVSSLCKVLHRCCQLVRLLHGSACTFISKSACLCELEWSSTRSHNLVLLSASMVLRIQTPSGDGRNDADIVDCFIYSTAQLVL